MLGYVWQSFLSYSFQNMIPKTFENVSGGKSDLFQVLILCLLLSAKNNYY